MQNSSNTLPANRLASVDVYRGFVMFLMMAEVWHFNRVSDALPNSSFWKFMAFNQDHVEWVGCSLHDLIQPSFSFLVGVVLPYSISNRLLQGGFNTAFYHALRRSAILILLGIFLRSQGTKQTYFTFEDTLTQIGLGYPILFILGFRNTKTQIATLVIIIVGYWLSFALYSLPNASFNYENVGVSKDWEHNLGGFAAHWNKNTNLAWAFDQWFLNLFPRENPFISNRGGYATLSFIPTLGTMILGLLAGGFLKKETSSYRIIKTFLVVGFGGIILGWIINWLGICPNVKRIWTPTWVLFSGGWCFILLAFFYWIVDVLKYTNWMFIFMVIGMNSIAAYVMAHTVDSYISKALYTHLGENYSEFLGIPYKTLVHGSLILFFEWLILWWMFKKKLFIKI